MGIIIHSLESVSFKDLYAAFSSAFKDYDFSLNADELRRMLDRRGYNPQLSFGVFFEGRLISFVFNGTGMYNNILTAYDTGTGTVPSFRGLHLTQKIFTFQPRIDMSTRSSAICTGSFATQSQSNKNISQIRL